jgi:hypothetical protein
MYFLILSKFLQELSKDPNLVLFLVYINDIVYDIASPIRLFADDTTLYIIVDNPLDAADELGLISGLSVKNIIPDYFT